MTTFPSCGVCAGAGNQTQQPTSRRRLLTWSSLLLTSAIVDIASCWTVILQGLSDRPDSFGGTDRNQTEESNRPRPGDVDIPAIVFALLCFAEAIRRAKNAKQRASDDAFLTNCEAQIGRVLTFTTFPSIQSFSKLSSTANFSSIGLHLMGQGDDATILVPENENEQTDEPPSETVVRRLLRRIQQVQLDRHTIRVWAHASLTLVAWISLLPLRLPIEKQNGDFAVASTLIAFSFTFCKEKYHVFASYLAGAKQDFIWNTALPFAVRKPRLFYSRFRKVVRGIRWTKFAIPLFKFVDKIRLRSLDSYAYDHFDSTVFAEGPNLSGRTLSLRASYFFVLRALQYKSSTGSRCEAHPWPTLERGHDSLSELQFESWTRRRNCNDMT